MPVAAPRIGVLISEEAGRADAIYEAGGEPIPIPLPDARPAGGIALVREWVADCAQISCARENLDGLLISAEEPEELAGFALAALRLNLPAVAATGGAYLSAAFAALGLAPLAADPADLVVRVAGEGGPRPLELVEDFTLANALRAAYSLGDGPETVVHLSAIAREAGCLGFTQMLRVLVPETPLLVGPDSGWFEEHGVAGLLAHLGDILHDTGTVEGHLREALPSAPPAPPRSVESRLVFVRGRVSGVEALCRVSGPEKEVTGKCLVCASEESAVRAVEDGGPERGSLLVVGGCGPRGGPGLLRLGQLREALEEAELADSIPVITDGLPPTEAHRTWLSLFTPEAAAGGVIGRLRNGDALRIDLEEGLIRTGMKAGELERRESYELPNHPGKGYAGRYASSALPALEGAGFG